MIDLLLATSSVRAVLPTAADDPGRLDRLADIVSPPPAPWWPPAPGWYVVAGIAAAALLAIAVNEFLRWRRNAYRRAALRELETLVAAAKTDSARWTELPPLLKRVALAAYPRHDVAGLSGEPWLAFLDETAGSHTFTAAPGQTLLSLAYDPQSVRRHTPEDLAKTADAVRAWIREHRDPHPAVPAAGGAPC